MYKTLTMMVKTLTVMGLMTCAALASTVNQSLSSTSGLQAVRVPEPSTIALLTVGLIAVRFVSKRRAG